MLNKKLPAGYVRKPGEEETFACFTEEDVTSLTTAASLVALAMEAHAEHDTLRYWYPGGPAGCREKTHT